MKKIEIDWNKVYEVNPKGLMQWLGYIPNSTLPYSCQSVKIDGLRFICDFGKGYDRHYTITFNTLNERALDLIFWFSKKEIYVYAIPLSLRNNVIFLACILDYNIYKEDYSTNNEAMAVSIKEAFELLKNKS